MQLQIDLETYSDINLRKCGLHKYVESPNYEILLFSYKFNDEPTRCVDLANGERVPLRILRAMADKTVRKTAHNAPFEIAGLIRWWYKLWAAWGRYDDVPEFDPMQWVDTLIRVAALSLPLSLDGAGKALNLNIAKDKRGKALITKFCVPCKPTKRNGMRTRNLPHHFPEDWEDFKAYNIRDVDVEAAILRKIADVNYMTRFERRLWRLDYRINTRGIMLDRHFINMVLRVDKEYRQNLLDEAIQITQLQNPNSLAQLRGWLEEAIGVEVPNLTKKDVKRLLGMGPGADVTRILEIRKELGKTSVKKYLAMWNAVCDDDRIRGTLQMYGAARTGRWAGRLMQTHNLPKNDMEKDALSLARKIVRTGDLSLIQLSYDNVQYILSQLIRTALIAPKNRRFLVGDFAAIEARVLAWLAGEKWRIKAFRNNRDIYLESASRMFKKDYDELVAMGKSSPYRQRGKIAELALGYQGAYGAMITMGALDMGISDEEILPIVRKWRNENENIVNLWYKVERAAKRVIERGGSETLMCGIKFVREHGQFFIILPSGRRLTYIQPRLEVNKFGKLGIKYQGLNDKNKWAALDTYGGKLVENIVQAIARDLLAEAMIRLDDAGYKIVFHVHDEIVAECRNDFGSCEEFDDLMAEQPDWAAGLPLKVESFETQYYQK